MLWKLNHHSIEDVPIELVYSTQTCKKIREKLKNRSGKILLKDE